MSLVSVVVPTFYRNDRLRRSLESVVSQRYDPIQTIVVDDSGERHAKPVVDSFRGVEYVAHDRNKGAQAARATGLENADGDYIQFLDDDDRLARSKIETGIDGLEGVDGPGVSYCGFVKEDGKRFPPAHNGPTPFLRPALRFENTPCVTSTMLIRRPLLDNIRPLETSSPGADDIRLCIKLAQQTKFLAQNQVLVTKGVDSNSRGRSWGAVTGRWDILEEFWNLYESLPDEVYRNALANAYFWQGLWYVESTWWSPRALYSFAHALRYAPQARLLHAAALVGACFGSPGWRLGKTIFDRFSGDETALY